MSFKKFLYKKKHYDYIVSLGYNREVAYKFLKYYNFEESSLLNFEFRYYSLYILNIFKFIHHFYNFLYFVITHHRRNWNANNLAMNLLSYFKAKVI